MMSSRKAAEPCSLPLLEAEFVVSAILLRVKGEFLVLDDLLFLGDGPREGGGDVNGVPSATDRN